MVVMKNIAIVNFLPITSTSTDITNLPIIPERAITVNNPAAATAEIL